MRPSRIVRIALCAAIVGFMASPCEAGSTSHTTSPLAVLTVVKAKVERTAHRVERKVKRTARTARAKTARAFHAAGRKVKHAARVVDAKAHAAKAKVRRALHS